ncbi:hypothetical protein Y032_0042g555 [Ancylostoma ceylanicum]|uniref:Uncharacterized protein n=1 Tax=Ancylostoma ceylanicum TaxID=53326 RepID=A0A016UET2_9BILA|nr:hypothetical protein Y032_0042g555 [Ancylostoma ceylanicum]
MAATLANESWSVHWIRSTASHVKSGQQTNRLRNYEHLFQEQLKKFVTLLLLRHKKPKPELESSLSCGSKCQPTQILFPLTIWCVSPPRNGTPKSNFENRCSRKTDWHQEFRFSYPSLRKNSTFPICHFPNLFKNRKLKEPKQFLYQYTRNRSLFEMNPQSPSKIPMRLRNISTKSKDIYHSST